MHGNAHFGGLNHFCMFSVLKTVLFDVHFFCLFVEKNANDVLMDEYSAHNFLNAQVIVICHLVISSLFQKSLYGY